MDRYSGILLPISSLPSRYGIGCFDRAAYTFVDWLAQAGQRYWQILPLGATVHDGGWDSPYQVCSAFAGNPYFISLEALIEEGVLTVQECEEALPEADAAQVDYQAMFDCRLPLLRKAYARSAINQNPDFHSFCGENFWWLEDYALFMAVREFFDGQPWNQWPEDIRMHYGPALDYYREKLYYEVEFHKYLQFQFWKQWRALKQYANDRQIQIVGDLPIYVSPDGADVWAQPELFQLDENRNLSQIAGCPPDAFAQDGQVWGNPLYRWEYHAQTGYHWWVTRMWYSYQLYDLVRLDHFRGFDEYFAIPAGASTARGGRWEKGPGMELFHTLHRELGQRPVIAEDLGLMTDGVRQLVRSSGYPNMKVLQFAFEPGDLGGSNEYLPHHYDKNCVVYTGTHDNETLSGWIQGMDAPTLEYLRDYLDDFSTPPEQLYQKVLRLAMLSTADTCVIPMQDWLGLDNTARMNTPGTVGSNWCWRMKPGALTEELASQVWNLTRRSGRANWAGYHQMEQTREEAQLTGENRDCDCPPA